MQQSPQKKNDAVNMPVAKTLPCRSESRALAPGRQQRDEGPSGPGEEGKREARQGRRMRPQAEGFMP
jgi:hypothetical protein